MPTATSQNAAGSGAPGFIGEHLALSGVGLREACNSVAPIGEEVHFRREV